MKKILFPTDFSSATDNAFIYALHIAKELGAELYILHTYMQPVLSSTHAGQPELVPEIYENYELEQFENFKKHSAQLHDILKEQGIADVPMSFLFNEGTLVSNIQQILEKENIELVIMGTNRAEGITEKIFGSNTVGVIRGIKVPVMSIPKEAKYEGIKEIVFTTLFREKDEPALAKILDIAGKFGVKVKCINVQKEKNVEIIAIADRWQKLFDNDKLEFVFLDFDQSIENTLNKYMEAHRVDILCVVKRNRSFLERLFTSSISNKLRIHTNTATLILQEGDDSPTF